MILAEKIMTLRKQRGWSQEELAMQVGVSRQAASKWESGASIPDLDKIIKLSELFGVSADCLIKDSMELEQPSELYLPEQGGEVKEQAKEVSIEEANYYMELVAYSAKKIAFGVSLCILSPVLFLLLGGLSEYGILGITEDMAGGIGVILLLIMVAIAVALFIIYGMQLEKYEYLEKEILNLQYGVAGIVAMKKEKFEPVFKQCIVAGVMLCITSVVPIMLAAAFEAEDIIVLYCTALLLIMIAFAVFLFVWAGMIHGSYQKLLEEGDYTVEKKLENKRNSNLSTVYWCIVTAIFLGYSFYTMKWHISWIIWPCAGVLYGAVLGVAAMLRKK